MISKHIPDLGIKLALYKGSEILDRIGEGVIREVVSSVLTGENIRSLTEGLTRRRLLISNAALLITYMKASKNIENFFAQVPTMVSKELTEKGISREKKAYLQWLVGLTGKSIQNVLRGNNPDELVKYLKELNSAFTESFKESENVFGKLSGTISIGDDKMNLDWPSILHIFTAIGAQTLAIRGAEKSMYGKLFEKLVLGSALSILGFEKIDSRDGDKKEKVFWLSQREEKRESDATVIVRPGIGVRFDIGFIGPGNSEISLDKVSRFEREIEHGRQKHLSSTIIVVDRIGDGSRIVGLAKQINGSIVQMSMSNWVREIASILKTTSKYEHEILKFNNEESIAYIKNKVKALDLKKFITKDAEEIIEEELFSDDEEKIERLHAAEPKRVYRKTKRKK